MPNHEIMFTAELDSVVNHYESNTAFLSNAPSCDAYLAAYAALWSANQVSNLIGRHGSAVADKIENIASAMDRHETAAADKIDGMVMATNNIASAIEKNIASAIAPEGPSKCARR